MKIYTFIFLLLGIVSLPAANHQKNILGEWLYSEKVDEGHLSSITSYRKNGEFTTVGVYNSKEEYFSYKTKGKWFIKGDQIHYEVTESNIPKYIKVGSTWSTEIRKIDKKVFLYTLKGERGSYKKLP